MDTKKAWALAAAAATALPAQAQAPATPATPGTPPSGPAVKASAVDPAQKAAIAAALEASARWLALMDEGKTESAWEQAAPLLQKAVGRSAWLDVGKKVRAPLGAVASRKPTAAAYTRDVPGAPPGEFVVIRYATSFAARTGVETVIPMRQADGSWKVATYRLQ